jgi:hypothetical protein
MTITDAVRSLDRDLHELFGSRLQSLVAYPGPDGEHAGLSTLAVVDRLTVADLEGCAARAAGWHDAGLAMPLVLAGHEFGRSLDAFPLEFGAILADHAVVSGTNPFEGLRVEPADLRRACEIQARSHLLHLREGYIETGGRGDRVADLLRRSARPLAALVQSVARLEGRAAATSDAAARQLEAALHLEAGSLADIVALSPSTSLTSDRARRLFSGYLDAAERLTSHIDKRAA